MSSTGNAEQTSIQSYKLVYTGINKSPDTNPAEFPIGITSGDIDLHTAKWGCKGDETKSNRLCFLFLADQAGAATVFMTGACEGGPEEPVCSLALTVGGTVESGTNRWCESMTVTSYHLAEDAILKADDGNGHPCKFGFDAIGYRYINFYVSGYANITWVKIYTRYF